MAFELQNHLMDTWGGHAEERLHVGLGRRPSVDRRVGVDEGQVLALQGRVRSRRCGIFSEFARHVASLCGNASGRVHESPREGPAEGARLDTIPMSDET